MTFYDYSFEIKTEVGFECIGEVLNTEAPPPVVGDTVELNGKFYIIIKRIIPITEPPHIIRFIVKEEE